MGKSIRRPTDAAAGPTLARCSVWRIPMTPEEKDAIIQELASSEMD